MKTYSLAVALGLAITASVVHAQSLSELPRAPAPTPTLPSISPSTPQQKSAPTKRVSENAKQPTVNLQAPAKSASAKVLPPPSKVTLDFYQSVVAGNLELADILLQKGADINCANCGGAPLLHWAINDIVIGQPKFSNPVLWLFERKADPNVQAMASGETPLHLVIGHALEFSKWSSLDGFYQLVRLFLDHGANPNVQDLKGWTAMHHAGMFLHLPITPSKTQFAQRVLRDFASAGADVNRKDLQGNSPLATSLLTATSGWFACNEDIGRTFLELGADPKLKNAKGQSAQSLSYELAVKYGKECNPLLKLFNSGYTAAPNAVSNPGSKPKTISLPVAIAGEYVGVVRVKTPLVYTAPVSGTFNTDGSMAINAPRGVTTVGFVSAAEGESINLRLKSKAPDGYKFANGQSETDEFNVIGSINDRIFRGSYESPMESGEFILCPQSLAPQRPECRPSLIETLNATLGVLLGQ
jgi:ankyrin repeat protein